MSAVVVPPTVPRSTVQPASSYSPMVNSSASSYGPTVSSSGSILLQFQFQQFWILSPVPLPTVRTIPSYCAKVNNFILMHPICVFMYHKQTKTCRPTQHFDITQCYAFRLAWRVSIILINGQISWDLNNRITACSNTPMFQNCCKKKCLMMLHANRNV
jgi:hypothetical protein